MATLDTHRGAAARRPNLWVDLRYRVPARYVVSWVALVAVGLAAAIVEPATYAAPSIALITAIAGVLILASIGQLLLVMLGAIDLSVASLMTLSAAVNVHYLDRWGSAGSFAAGMALCMTISLLSGMLISVFGLNSLIVTLAVNTIASAALLLWMGQTFSSDGQAPAWLRDVATGHTANISTIFTIAIIVAGVAAGVLGRTQVGRQLVSAGTNRRAARILGVPVVLLSLSTFALAGALYAVAGALLAGLVRVPNSDLGDPYMLTTITVVALAGALFSGGPVSFASLVAASLLLQVLDQALAIANLSPGTRLMVQGIVLVLAVAANTLSQFGRRGGKRLLALSRRHV